jgi:hypothetical protein
MKAKATKPGTTQARRLPDEEWNFSDQLRDTKNASLVRGIFFYEYSRASSKLRKLVRKFRDTPRPHVSGWEKINYSILSLAEKEKLRQETNGWDFTGELVEALMNNHRFPRTPALKMLKDANPNTDAKQWFCTLGLSPAIRLCTEITEAQNMKHALDQAWGNPGIEYRFKGAFKAQEFESVFPLAVDWRSSDKQIIAGLRQILLERRPERFQQFKDVSSQQVPFGNFCDKLPFRLPSALAWLGVYLRLERAKTWRKFFELYDSEALQNRNKGVVKSRDIDELARPRQEDYRKARLILECFENGTALRKADFK